MTDSQNCEPEKPGLAKLGLAPQTRFAMLSQWRGTRRQAAAGALTALAVPLLSRRITWAADQKRMTATPGIHEHFVTHEGRQRRYQVYVPRGYDGRAALPVVVGYHGGGSRPEAFREQAQLEPVADRHGFLVVYPDGSGRAIIAGKRILTFNAGTCCGYALKNKVDDVGFTAALLDDLPRHYPLDEERVYLTGMSNGAMMVYRLACELSERIAAIGPVAGDMGVDGPAPKRPVPVIHFHGQQDQNAPFHGGLGERSVQPNPHRSIPETIQYWIKFNGCQPQPVERQAERDFVRELYAPLANADGAPIEFYTLPDGGHTWPGGKDITAHLNTGRLIASVHASELMWQFFTHFSRANRLGTRR